MARLKEKYRKEIGPALKKKFGYSNVMLVPRIKKVVVNMGIGEATKDRNMVQDHVEELAVIAGQRPVITRARLSIAGFKLREEQAIGAMVTLRGDRMYDFIDRLVHIVLPRIRDFRGLYKGCDGNGNYSFGLDSQEMFPEVNLDKVKRSQGMTITIVTSAKTDDECHELLELIGVPFRKERRKKAA